MQMRIIDSHLNIEYLNKYSNGKLFIETGTYLGDTIWMVLESALFDKIHSSEINAELYNRAVQLFDHKPQVVLWKEESYDCIAKVMKDLNNETATFWLDAHASGPLHGGKHGGSPVLLELEEILKSGNNQHTIFIDDRRLFGSAEWNGVKEEDAINLLKKINPDYNIFFLDGHVEKDVICATVKPK